MADGLKLGVVGFGGSVVPSFEFKSYNFEPKDDMTPVEAVYCALLFAQVREIWDLRMFVHLDKISRHFVGFVEE